MISKKIQQRTNGSMLSLQLQCMVGQNVSWQSQLTVPNTSQPMENVALTAATVLLGNTYDMLEISEAMKLSIMSGQTYCRIQQQHIQPAVSDAYATLLQQAKETVKQHSETVLIGDGR